MLVLQLTSRKMSHLWSACVATNIMICQKGIIKNNLHKPSFTRSFDSALPPEFRSTVQPLPFRKCQAGDWRRTPKWLIKSHSDATRASWKSPLMSAVSNVSHRKSHKRQQPSQANYWGRGAAENGLPQSRSREHPSSRWREAMFCAAGWRQVRWAGGVIIGDRVAPRWWWHFLSDFRIFPSFLEKISPRK